jgi:hypothetical protein
LGSPVPELSGIIIEFILRIQNVSLKIVTMKTLLITGLALFVLTATESFKGRTPETRRTRSEIKSAVQLIPITDSVPADTTKRDSTKTPPTGL